MEEERALAVPQAVDKSVSLKLRKLQTQPSEYGKREPGLMKGTFLIHVWNR